MPNVLIFSVSIGAGHDLAAKALASQLEQSCSAKVKIIDTFQYINPFLDKVIRGSYMETLRFSPKVWGYLYDQAETSEHFVDLSTILSKLLSPKLEELVRAFTPDVIICTHAFPCGMLSKLKEKRNITVPLIAILTDFTVHPFWIHDYVDRYVLPSNQLKYNLMGYGVPEDKIWPYGLPIRDEFSNPLPQEEARNQLGLANLSTVLIMGGGLGLGSIESLTEAVTNCDLDLQVLVVAGKNQKLYETLKSLQTRNPLHVYGFVDNMGTILKAADLVISKPGGLTTAEVLACHKPMMIVAPIPGQEERNTDFLLNNGVAVKAKDVHEVVPLLKQLLNNPARITRIQEAAQSLGLPRAAATVVSQLTKEFKLCEQIG